MVPGKCGIGGDYAGDLGLEGINVAGDLFEALGALALKDRDGQVLLPVFKRGAVAHQPVASIDQSGQLGLVAAFGGSDRWLESGHPGQGIAIWSKRTTKS